MQWLKKSWFLVALVVLLPSGMVWGMATTEEWRLATAGRVNPAVTTVMILFLMSFTLDSAKLGESFRSPKPVLWGAIVNLVLMPLMAWPLAGSHRLADFTLGLMVAAAVPCTLATASVSTRQAGGNDAISLLVTLVTNLVGVVLTPFWLKWTVAVGEDIDTTPIIRNLVVAVLLPTILGQSARLMGPLGRFATTRKFGLSIVAQSLVLCIVTKTAIEAGGRIQGQSSLPPVWDFARLIVHCVCLHVAAMVIAELGGRWMRLSREDRIAAMFAGSQKTLPVGLLLAAMPAVTGGREFPFVTFPLLIFHASQLLVDSAIADRIATHADSLQ